MVLFVIGSLLILCGVMMALVIPVSLYHQDGDHFAFIYSSLITLSLGLGTRYLTRASKNEEIKKREGYLIVTLGWLTMAFTGTLPYVFDGTILSYTDAFFESMSGFTTTGASILNDIESLPNGILFWRSMTQFIGGMGIIVLTIAILPMLGIGGMELFVAEAPGPTKDKIHPRIKETAKRLWVIYMGLTIILIIALKLGGLSFFDSFTHAFTTMSTGGFSTQNTSMNEFSGFIQYVTIIFMFIAGTNFTLLYFALKGKVKKIWKNDEFKWYLIAIGFFFILIFPVVYHNNYTDSLEEAFRNVLFQVVSVITTTGYSSAYFTDWGPFVTFLFFLLFFSGASAGSTSGGFKLIRIVLLVKNGFVELKKRLHPSAIIPVYLNKTVVPSKITYNLLAFMFLFLLVFVIGSIVMMAMMGHNYTAFEAMSASATAVGNVGPGVGSIGPDSNFSEIPMGSKWVMSFLMLCGRLELFTVILILTPFFWRRI